METMQAPPGHFESSHADDELLSRMTRVLQWIADGDPGRFEDYARIASETVAEAREARKDT